MRELLYRGWLRFLAIFRLSDYAICEMSKDLGIVDYHDYGDSRERMPYHFTELTCRRCGKKYII